MKINGNQFIIIIFINLFYSSVVGQNLPNPINLQNNAYGPTINSDYGPRHHTTNFHYGIDYDEPTLGNAFCITNGENFSTGSLGTQNTYIQVGNWRYMHVLEGSIQNRTWELTSTGILILRQFIDNNLQTTQVFVDANYDEDIYIDRTVTPICTVSVSRNVPYGVNIFKARDYGDVGEAEDHLHFEYLTNNFTNPMQYLARTVNNTFTLATRYLYNVNNVATIFPNAGILYGNQVIIENDVNYGIINNLNNLDFDVLNVEISNDGSAFSSIYTWRYSGPNHMVPNSSSDPRTTIRQIGSTDQLANIQSSILEGIFPMDFPANAHDFLKLYWNSQETEAGSNNLFGFKYPDGNYQIRNTATNLTNYSKNTTNSFVLDNTMPYVKTVQVFKTGNSTPIYDGTWIWNGSSLAFSSSNNGQLKPNDQVTIHVICSEPMKNVKILCFGVTYDLTSVGDAREWVSGNITPVTGNQTIKILKESLDLNNNGLFGFSNSQNSVTGTSIPKHLSNNTWSSAASPQNDTRHQIIVGQSNTPIAAFTADKTNGVKPLIVKFTDQSTNSPTSWTWNFGDNGTSSSQNPSHTYSDAGTYPICN